MIAVKDRKRNSGTSIKNLEYSYFINNSIISNKEESSPKNLNDQSFNSFEAKILNKKESLDKSNNSFVSNRRKFYKVGLEVINSNHVMMNFNKKNYLGIGYVSNHKKKAQQKKIIPNNILIDKDAQKVIEGEEQKINPDNSAISLINDLNLSNISNVMKKEKSFSSIKSNNMSLVSNKLPDLRSRKKLSYNPLKMNYMSKTKDDNPEMDNCVNFMRDMPSNDFSLINHVRLFEVYLEIEGGLDTFGNGNAYSISVTRRPSLSISLKKYFSILRDDYDNSVLLDFSSEFFLFDSVNKLYLKSMKIQIIVLMILLVCLNHLVCDSNLKLSIKKLMAGLTLPVVNIFENFMYGQILLNHNEIFLKYLKPNFPEKYLKILKGYKLTKSGRLSESAVSLNKHLDSLVIMIKQFSTQFFKFNQLKPIHNIVYDLLKDYEKISFAGIERIICKNVLYGHLSPSSPPKIIKNVFSKDFKNIELNKSFFLPPIENRYTYTLVLDLDETLIHSFCTPVGGGMFLVRPYALEFLKELSPLFEIVIFTAGTKEYADDILDKLDKEGYIYHRLYRNHTSNIGLYTIKDLSKLGRDLSKVIIVDNVSENFKLQPNNGLWIKTWDDDINDHQLPEIKRILTDIHTMRITDVRTVLKKIKEEFYVKKTYQNIEVPLY